MPRPLFKLSQPAFTISGRGVCVLTCVPTSQASPFSIGDILVFHSPWTAKKAIIQSIEYARSQAREEYALLLRSISTDDLPAGTEVHMHNTMVSDRDTEAPIVWTGDLEDDCTALWADLLLRAEEMSLSDWWWAVSDNRLAGAEIGSSNWTGQPCVSGDIARKRAEQCARNYLAKGSRALH